MIEHASDILIYMACAIMATLVLALTWDWLREWYEGDTEGDDEPDHDERELR